MRVFLTGATGLIGGEVARRLVARGHRVTAAVHRHRQVLGNDGAAAAVAGTEAIDLAVPALGLADGDAARIAATHDLILHCAATVRFDLPDIDYRAINVDGTGALLRLAAMADLPLLHVSTAYVCGSRDGVIREDDPLPASGFANGYEASKAAAEALVMAASQRHVVARPSIVVGEHRTGAIRSFEAIYAVLKLLAEGQVRTVPASAGATLDLVPIDHVAGALVALAERIEAAAGRRFHLVSGTPIAVGEWIAAIAAYPGFAVPVRVDPDGFDPASLPSRERFLSARITSLYDSYLQRAPIFDDSGLRTLTGLACPATDRAFLVRLFDYAVASGFVTVSGRAGSAAPTACAHPAPTAFRP